MENEKKENAESGSERTICARSEIKVGFSLPSKAACELAGTIYNRLMKDIAPVVAKNVETFIMAFCETVDEFLSESEGRGQESGTPEARQ